MFSFLVHVFFPCLGFFHVFHVFMCINFSDDIGNSMNFVQWFLTWNAAQHLYLHVNRHVFPLLLSLTTFFWIGWSNQKKSDRDPIGKRLLSFNNFERFTNSQHCPGAPKPKFWGSKEDWEGRSMTVQLGENPVRCQNFSQISSECRWTPMFDHQYVKVKMPMIRKSKVCQLFSQDILW